MKTNLLEHSKDTIDWEQILKTKDVSCYGEQDIYERLEDMQELLWLIRDCELKITKIERMFTKSSVESKVVNLFREKCGELFKQVSYFSCSPININFTTFIRIKYQIRMLLKQLAGFINSDHWQSPALTVNLDNSEKGVGQIYEDVYMRMNGHECIDDFQEQFINQYIRIPKSLKNKTLGYLTNSGMKALELALISYKTITKDKLPLYYQEGYYYEGITLINNLYYDADALAVDEIYKKLENNEEIGCLLLDPGTTWPIHSGVDLDLVFSLLEKHKQRSPMFLVVDRTITSISNQVLEKYKDNIPSYVVLIVVESGIKYYQQGLDLVNLGLITFTGNIFRMSAYRDVIKHLTSVLSVYLDPSLLYRLPQPRLFYAENRLKRMSRNTNILISFYNFLKEKHLIDDIYSSVSSKKEYRIRGQPWLGTLIYIKHHNSLEYTAYMQDAKQIINSEGINSHFNQGSSFGFDTNRLCVVEEMFKEEPNCALRLSVGRESIQDILKSSLQLYQFYTL